MALIKHELVEILGIIREHKYKSMCMIGKQNIIISHDELLDLCNYFAFEFNGEMMDQAYCLGVFDSELLFRAFGVEEVTSLDYSDYEGAGIIFDLNSQDLPQNLKMKFDIVINGGTLEHVFNISNAMDNINNLVSPKGTILHISPCSGWVNHGFYSISPTFFMDYYENNKDIFDIKNIYIEVKKNNGPKMGDVILSPDCREISDINSYVNFFGDREKLIICECERKNNDKNLSICAPIQGMYVDMYKSQEVQIEGMEINAVLEEIKRFGEKKVSIYGAGNYGSILVKYCLENELDDRILAIFDKDVKKTGERIGNIEIKYPTTKELNKSELIIVAVKGHHGEIFDDLKRRGYEKRNIALK